MPMDLWRDSSVSFLAPAGSSSKSSREGELCDDEQHDEPVQQLGDGAPAARGVSQAHDRKLMRLNASCLLQRLSGLALRGLAGRLPGARRRLRREPPAPAPAAAAHTGTPYDDRAHRVAPDDPGVQGRRPRRRRSQPCHRLARAERHLLRGGRPAAEQRFEVHVPLETSERGRSGTARTGAVADFPPEVPETAREGTRRNMLGDPHCWMRRTTRDRAAARCGSRQAQSPPARRAGARAGAGAR